jgi:hypothetical protein
MLYQFIQFMNKRYRIPKRQSRMEHPEKLASLRQQSTGRQVAPFGHIILIPSEPVYSLANSANAKFIVVDLTPPAPKSSIYLSQGMNSKNYTTEEVFRRCEVFAIN